MTYLATVEHYNEFGWNIIRAKDDCYLNLRLIIAANNDFREPGNSYDFDTTLTHRVLYIKSKIKCKNALLNSLKCYVLLAKNENGHYKVKQSSEGEGKLILLDFDQKSQDICSLGILTPYHDERTLAKARTVRFNDTQFVKLLKKLHINEPAEKQKELDPQWIRGVRNVKRGLKNYAYNPIRRAFDMRSVSVSVSHTPEIINQKG